MGIFALKDIYIKIKEMNPISDKIQALIDQIIAEARKAPEPEQLSGFFSENPNAQFFSIVQRMKSGGDADYDFKIENHNGHKMIRDINKATKTKNCLADARFDTMIYGTQFRLNFGKCGDFTINNVVGVKLFADENSLKSGKWIDSYELDTDLDKSNDELVNQYYETLKGLEIGDNVYIDSKFKWDGEVTRKGSSVIQVELNRSGLKGQPLNLDIDLNQNPFYLADGEIMFKSKANKRDEKLTPVNFDIPIKSFSVDAKSKPKRDKSAKSKPKKDKPNEMGDEQIQKLKSDGKKALDYILSDPTLKKAFYSQPSFFELLKAEISGKKAVGKGIVPTLNIVRNYIHKKDVQVINSRFIPNQQVTFNIIGGDIILTDKNDVQFTLKSDYPRVSKVKKSSNDERYLVGEYTDGEKRYVFYVNDLKPTGVLREYYCDFYTIDENGKVKDMKKKIKIKINAQNSPGYKNLVDKGQETKSQFKKQ